MKRVVVGLVCFFALLLPGAACCRDACTGQGGLLDLVFDVAAAPIDLLGHVCGQETTLCLSTGTRPGQCVPAQCVPKGPRNRAHPCPTLAYGPPAPIYTDPCTRGSCADCRPRTPKGRYVSSHVVRPTDCPDCPGRRISAKDRVERVAEPSSKTVPEKEQPGPKEIVVRVETKAQPKSPREIIVNVEPGQGNQPAREPVVKVVTNPPQTPAEETVVKVETKPLPAPAKETVVRVEIKQEPAEQPPTAPSLPSASPEEPKKITEQPAVQTPTAPLQPAPQIEKPKKIMEAPTVQTPTAPIPPAPKPQKPRKGKKLKSRGFGGCAPYGIGYY